MAFYNLLQIDAEGLEKGSLHWSTMYVMCMRVTTIHCYLTIRSGKVSTICKTIIYFKLQKSHSTFRLHLIKIHLKMRILSTHAASDHLYNKIKISKCFLHMELNHILHDFKVKPPKRFLPSHDLKSYQNKKPWKLN